MTVQVKTQNGGTLNLRQNTSTSSAILAQIPNGTKLEVEKVNDTWSKVTFKNKTGFVVSQYLSEITTNSIVTKEDLQRIYNDLKTALATIESILK